jgi:hypothetical protein
LIHPYQGCLAHDARSDGSQSARLGVSGEDACRLSHEGRLRARVLVEGEDPPKAQLLSSPKTLIEGDSDAPVLAVRDHVDLRLKGEGPVEC